MDRPFDGINHVSDIIDIAIQKVSAMKSQYDLIILGGGITGAAILRLAAENKLSALLIEKNDFASGSSSQSSKMIHGGLRYLEMLDFKVSKESCDERNLLVKSNPEFVNLEPFYFPLYHSNLIKKIYFKIGFIIYDHLAKTKLDTGHYYIDKKELSYRIPQIKQSNNDGAFIYYDSFVDDARLVIETIKTAEKKGAEAINYTTIDDLYFEEKKVKGVVINQQIVKAKHVINATGYKIDIVRELAEKKQFDSLLISGGVHFVLSKDKFPIQGNLTLRSPIDQRPVFVMDWGDSILFGTTDYKVKDELADHHIDERHQSYLLENFRHFFPDLPITMADIQAVQFGIRSLIKPKKSKDSHKISREHFLKVDPSGLISIAGGKLTTHRLIAKEVLELIYPQISLDKTCYIFGNQYQWRDELLANVPEQLQFMAKRSYGPRLAEFDNSKSFIFESVRIAIHEEHCKYLKDYMYRRFRFAIWDKSYGLNYKDDIINAFLMYSKFTKQELNSQFSEYEKNVSSQYI